MNNPHRFNCAPFVVLMCVILIGLTQNSAAQQPYFKQFVINRESPSLSINKLFIDRTGFIWVGTSEGLYQSDGTEYLQFLLGNKQPNEVTALYQDKSNILWVGYKNGNIATFKNDSLFLFNPPEGLPKKTITDIASDTAGNIWFTTAGEGVYYIRNNRLYNLDTDDGLTDNYCYAIELDAKGNLCIGTDQGISVCQPLPKGKVIKLLKTANGLPDEIVRVLQKDGDGNIWVGMQEKGICKIDGLTGEIETAPCFLQWQNGAVNDLCVNANEIWIATEDSGLVYCDRRSNNGWRTFETTENFKLGKVTTLIADKQKNVWLGCDAGLVRTHGMWLTFLTTFSGSKVNYVHSIFCDSHQNLFFTPDQGLVKIPYDPSEKLQKFELTPPKNEIDIVSMFEDDAGYLWVGTMGAGLFRLNHHTGVKQKINLPDANLSVLSIAGNDKELWLGTFGGAVKLSFESTLFSDVVKYNIIRYDHQKEIGNYYIYSVLIDSKKRVWFGTDQKGLTCYHNEQFVNPFSKELSDKTIYSIVEDKAGNIWCSVADEGAVMLGNKGIKKWGRAEGLRELSITSICPLDMERIAFIHRRGLDIVNTRTNQVDYFGTENNLENINPDLNAVTRDRKGRFWIGTEKGIVVLNPLLNAGTLAPQVVIKHATLYSKNNSTQQHFFNYDENALAFDYTGLWFTAPARINYQYKLEGLNDQWIDTKDKRLVFPNLAPGKYVFKVRVSIQRSFSNSSEASYTFFIAEPFWKENWFRISGIIIIGMGVYFYLKKRDERLRRLESLKKEKIEFQFETLKSQVNPHFLFNSFNTLIGVIEDDKEKAISYVEKLSDFFRIVVTYKDKQIITLAEELDVAKNYFELQQQRFGKSLALHVNIRSDLMHTVTPPLVLQILIENVIKHNSISVETPLVVSIYSDRSRIAVSNNINRKRTVEPSTGTGLQNIINRYKLLTTEEVLIVNTVDIFTIFLPIIKNE